MDEPQRLAQVFVELADTLVEEFDVVEFLQVLSERSMELLGAGAAGLMLADQRGALRAFACAPDQADVLELFELQQEGGPCRVCFASGQSLTNVELTAGSEEWPELTARAVSAGFGFTHALPMRLRDQVIGALNLFTGIGQRLDQSSIAIGQAMADVATIGLLHERTLREKTVLSEQLQTALQSRILIEQAKGVIAARADITIAEAFDRLRGHARSNGLGLTVVATAVIDGDADPAILAPR